MSINRGLPKDTKMKHNSHYVEDLFKSQSTGYDYRMLGIETIEINEEQPRFDIGDMEGLVLSIREKGVLEPILVRKIGENYSIISGERRYRASKEVGLTRIPAIILEADDMNTLEIALIENIQRKDLTPFEEGDGYKVLYERFNVRHEDIARKIGKSRNNITETITLSRMPDDLREMCLKNGITSKSVLIEIAREESREQMLSLIEDIINNNLSRNQIRAIRRGKTDSEASAEKQKPFIFKFRPRNKKFVLNLKFKTAQEPSKEDIIETLLSIVEQLQEED